MWKNKYVMVVMGLDVVCGLWYHPSLNSICLFQRCTPPEKWKRLVGSWPIFALLQCVHCSKMPSSLITCLKWATYPSPAGNGSSSTATTTTSGQDFTQGTQFPQNRWVTPIRFLFSVPFSPHLSAFYLIKSNHFHSVTLFSFSVFAQNHVHPESDPDWNAMGECHLEPLPVRGHYHPGAHLRVSETARQVKKCGDSEPKRDLEYKKLPSEWLSVFPSKQRLCVVTG